MKKISAFLLSAFLIMSISVGAMAESPLISSVTLNNGTVVVEGTCAGDKPLTIEVLQSGKEWTDIAAAEENAEVDISALLSTLYYFNQTDSFGENGSFEFTIDDWAEAEEPEMRVYSGGEYFYHSPETIKEINAASNVTDFKSKVTGHAFLAGEIEKIEKNILNDIDSEKNEFWEKLFNYKESIKDAEGNTIGFKNFGEIVAAAPEIALLTKVRVCADAKMAETLALLENYGIKESNSWDIYVNENTFAGEDYLTDEQETALNAGLKQKAYEYYRTENFVEYFNDSVVLTACRGRGSSYLVRTVIESSDILAAEGTGDFSSLSAENKLAVAEIIDGADTAYTTISALAKKIADSAKPYADDDDDDGYTPPTGGGGGGGGGGKTYAVEKAPQEDEEATQSKNKFSDLASHKWAEEAIYALQEKGIVQGTGDDTFEPARAVTREEFVKMLVLSADILDESATVPFSDAQSGAWYVPYVGSAYNAKLINGITEDMFGIGKVITREQLAVMIYRALVAQGSLQSTNASEPFSDIDKVSDFATDAVNYMKATGLMNGMGDGSFAPHENVNRAQAAKVIYELLQRL